jgi:N-acetylmuramoyl-L-alanine amidase
VAVYAGVFALIVAVVAVGYRAPQQVSGVANTSTTTNSAQTQQTSVDAVVATNIAANLAETTNLSVATNVANMSVALTAESELAQANDAIVSKPQILQPTAENRTIITYVTVAGDSVDSIAAQFGLTKETVRWANNLTSDALAPGKSLKILPVDGINYTVRSGDTVQSIATKYKADVSRVILYNDLDVTTDVTAGQQLIVPGGVLPDTERPGYIAPRVFTYNSGSNDGSSAGNIYRASAGNRYTYGYCTWYVYERRAELGRPIGSFWGNASNWAYAASAAGFTVNRSPEVGAIIQNGGGLGHVAIVESIAANGDITLSEMNYGGGWNQIHRGRVISAGQASLYNYIH